MQYKTLSFLILIILLGIGFRFLLSIHSSLLFEPDNFFYLSMIKQVHTIPLPNTLFFTLKSALSGFPAHNIYSAGNGLILLPLLSNNVIDSMGMYSVLMGIISIILAFSITYLLTKNDKYSLMASFFMAVIPAAVFKTSFVEFRGETFVPVFLGILILGIMYIFEKREDLKSLNPLTLLFCLVVIIGAILEAIVLILNFWNGAAYILAVFLVFFLMMILLYIFPRKNLNLKHVNLYVNLFIFLSCFSILLIGLIASKTIYIPVFSQVASSFSQTGINTIIAETQSVTLGSLIANFGFALILAPIGLFVLYEKDQNNSTYLFSALLLVTFFISLLQTRWNVLAALPISILGGIGFIKLQEYFGSRLKVILPLIILTTLILSAFVFITTLPADNINPQFISALAWVNHNTSSNSTFLTMWDDGSLIEGIGNRTSYTDSVAGFKPNTTIEFARFLYQPAGNFSYIANISPDYLLVRQYWRDESLSNAKLLNLSPNTSLNNTNYGSLLKGNQTIVGTDNITLIRVYQNNDTTIYKVLKR